MAEGYDTCRFHDKIDEGLTCPICFGVLKEPMQCQNNEHYFCSCCIKQHLEKTSLSCPVCKDQLTLETLRKAPRMIAELISRLKISCDNATRGCDVVVELEALQKHLQECDFMPVTCSNEGCNDVMNRRDVKHHEQELCRFKTTNCDDCEKKMPHHKYGAHGCVLRRQMDEMKKDLAEGLQEMKYAQHEMMNEVRQDMKRMTIAIENLEKSCRNVSNQINTMNTDIVVIAGIGGTDHVHSSVERFNLFNQTWTRMPELNQARVSAASVLFENQILVCGGSSSTSFDNATDSIEVLDMNDPTEWKECSIKLPIKVTAHKCVVYGNRLLIFGGLTKGRELLDTIYQLLLVPPYSSKLLCHMKKKRAFHGLEMFADDKVLIAGGWKAETDVELFDITRNECVEMPPLPTPLEAMATVRRGDTMLLIGGFDDKNNPSNDIIEYDFKTAKSRVRLAMNRKRTGCSAVYHRGTLVILGGTKDHAVNAVDCFNFSSNSWKKLPSMIEARAHASALIVNKKNFEF